MDGYFPLRESVRQLLVRQGFAAAWISLAHAPIMDLPDIAPEAPVPLRLRPEAAGTIRSMAMVAVAGAGGPRLRGAARWSWFSPRPSDAKGGQAQASVDPAWRFAEPVFVRGIGLLHAPDPGQDGGIGRVETTGFGTLARADAGSPVALLRSGEQEGANGMLPTDPTDASASQRQGGGGAKLAPNSRLWGVDAWDAILREDLLPRPGLFGAAPASAEGAGARECLVVTPQEPQDTALADRIATDR